MQDILPALLERACAVAAYANSLGLTVLYEPQGFYVNGLDGFTRFFEEMKQRGYRIGVCGDVGKDQSEDKVHLVISVHACDIATDLVLSRALAFEADVILSTPCCHHAMSPLLDCSPLAFITKHSMLRQKLCDAATDALRLKILEAHGYTTAALELIDPEETPKNVLLRAIRKKHPAPAAMQTARDEAEQIRAFLLGDATPWWANVNTYSKGEYQ